MHPTPPVRLPSDRSGLAVVSDDTQMTLFTAEGMIRACQRFRDRGICSPQDVLLHAYLRWYNTQTDEGRIWGGRGYLVDDPRLRVRRAPGNTCLSALSEWMRETPSSADKRPNDSKGCGAVMRAAPIGLGTRDRQAAFELGRDAGRLTHGHPLGFLSSAFLASVVHDVARGTALPTAIGNARALTRRERGGNALVEAADRACPLAGNGKPDAPTIESLGGGWVGEEALAIALLCALTADISSAAGVIDALWRAAAHSGDSDSTSAIAGNIIGAMVGIEGLEPGWLEHLELRDVIDRLAKDLFLATVKSVELDMEDYPPN